MRAIVAAMVVLCGCDVVPPADAGDGGAVRVHLSFPSAPYQRPAKPTHWRITYGPGNSLTNGAATPDGNAWRKVVNDGLNAAGVSYELVGRVAAEGTLVPPWNACEGYPSHLMAATADNMLYARVPGMGQAEIFVIDAFTVDVASGRTLEQMVADASALLDAVLAKATWGVVIAKSLPFGAISGIPNTNMVAINAALDGIATARLHRGFRVVVIDQYTGADMDAWSSDGVHITDPGGQAFMGANVLAGVQALLGMN